MTQKPAQSVYVIPVGTSEPLDIGLRHNNGDPIIGTGVDVELEIYQKVDDVWTAITENPPTVAWLGDAANGNVRISGHETLTVDNYRVRYKLTDASDKVGYCPNQERSDLWKVVAIAN